MKYTTQENAPSSIKALAPIASTQDNFPALAHSFEYADCDFDANTITCGIAGVVLNLNELVDQGDGTFGAGNTIAGGLTGSLTLPGTTDTLVLWITASLDAISRSFTIGNPASLDGIDCSPSTGSIGSDANYHTQAAQSLGATPALNSATASAINWLGNVSKSYFYDEDKTSVEVDTDTANTNINDGIVTGANFQRVSFGSAAGTVKIKGAYVLYFTSGLPEQSEIANALAWMAHNDGIYPLWKGKL